MHCPQVCFERERFAPLFNDSTAVTVFDSTPSHFRQRVRFALAPLGEGGSLAYALFNRGSPSVAVDQFPIASRAINKLMPSLMAAINASEPLRSGAAACHFLATQRGEMLVSLVYGTPLHGEWREAAEGLRRELGIQALVGRTKGTPAL